MIKILEFFERRALYQWAERFGLDIKTNTWLPRDYSPSDEMSRKKALRVLRINNPAL